MRRAAKPTRRGVVVRRRGDPGDPRPGGQFGCVRSGWLSYGGPVSGTFHALIRGFLTGMRTAGRAIQLLLRHRAGRSALAG